MRRKRLSMKLQSGWPGYLYDQPSAAGGAGYANAIRNSGAAPMLLPYRVHRAGSVREEVV